MKKLVVIMVSFLFAIVPVFAGGNGEAANDSGEGTVTLRFMNWGSAEESTKAAFSAMIAKFEADNPDIKIENIPLPFNQMLDQLLILNAGGTPPDVAQLSGYWMSAVTNAGMLADMGSLVPAETLSDFYPTLLESLTYDGTLYALPWSPSPVVLYYNKELLRRAGIENPPTTMQELFDYAERISALGSDGDNNTIYGLGIQSKKLGNAGLYFLPYIWNYGGDLVDENGNVSIGNAGTQRALTVAQKLFDNNITPAGLEIKDLRNLFAQGNLGFHFDGDFGYPVFLGLSPEGTGFAKDIGITQVPRDSLSMTNPYLEHNLGVFAGSAHQEAATRFALYLSSPEAMAIYNANNGNKTPGRYSVESLPFYSNPENAHMQIFIDTMGVAKPFPQKSPNFLAAMEELAEGIQRVGINNEDPSIVTSDLQARIERIYAEN